MGKLSIRNLTKSYGDHTVVNKVNIEVDDSQLLTIVGPSGCGKTTILRMIAGFIEPTGGQIYLDDKLLVDVENRIAPIAPEKRCLWQPHQRQLQPVLLHWLVLHMPEWP